MANAARPTPARAALLAAGRRLFAQSVPDSFSIDDIVAAAGVGKGSFYNHFSDREALMAALVSDIRARVEMQVTVANSGIDSPAERIARAMAVYIRFAHCEPQDARILTRIVIETARPQSLINQGVVDDVRAGIDSGAFEGLSLDAGVIAVLSLTHAAMLVTLEGGDGKAMHDATTRLMALLLRGLGVASPVAMAIADAAMANDSGH